MNKQIQNTTWQCFYHYVKALGPSFLPGFFRMSTLLLFLRFYKECGWRTPRKCRIFDFLIRRRNYNHLWCPRAKNAVQCIHELNCHLFNTLYMKCYWRYSISAQLATKRLFIRIAKAKQVMLIGVLLILFNLGPLITEIRAQDARE